MALKNKVDEQVNRSQIKIFVIFLSTIFFRFVQFIQGLHNDGPVHLSAVNNLILEALKWKFCHSVDVFNTKFFNGFANLSINFNFGIILFEATPAFILKDNKVAITV